jgi:CheY-like chemotaxis protein
MHRIFVLGLLACLAGASLTRAQSNSGAGTHSRLDQTSERLEKEAEDLARALTNQVAALRRVEQERANTGINPWFFVALGLGAILVLRKAAPKVAARFSETARPPSRKVAAPGRASDVGPVREPAYSEPSPAPPQNAQRKEPSSPGPDPLEEFFGNVSRDLASLRQSLCELGRELAPDEQQKLLRQLLDKIRALRSNSNIPGVRPLWQLAGAIEGLLNHLTAENEGLKPSSLRTLANAIDLLHSLSVRGLRADLAVQPTPRLLAVDDDPVSRYAVASAMKRFLVKPDMATHGEAGLALADDDAYDLILLDVQMPGMDGFELCSKIHATAQNRTTPIVFVTCQSDFDARAKSSLIGGQELIGKPFSTFELSLKALTLVLRRRLQSEAAPSAARSQSATPSAQPAKATPSKASEWRAAGEPALASPQPTPA